MIYRVCPDCGAMLPDNGEEVRKHLKWHSTLVDVLAKIVTDPEGWAHALEQWGKT